MPDLRMQLDRLVKEWRIRARRCLQDASKHEPDSIEEGSLQTAALRMNGCADELEHTLNRLGL